MSDISKQPYHVRRVLGQLASCPAAWWVELDAKDMVHAEKLLRLGLVERRTATATANMYRRTDEGQRAWMAAVGQFRGEEESRLLAFLADIRHALGDDGRRMQPEFLDYCRGLRTQLAAAEKERDEAKAWAEFVRSGSAYAELVDALCSKSWAPRNDHQSVLAVAKKMREHQLKIIPMGERSMDELLKKFCETMKWSADTTEHEKSLVYCNLNGFVAFCRDKRAERADAKLAASEAKRRELVKLLKEIRRAVERFAFAPLNNEDAWRLAVKIDTAVADDAKGGGA